MNRVVRRWLRVTLLGLLSLTTPLRAQGVITTLSGLIATGETVVLQGSGFGAKQTAAPVRWQDFESASPGDLVSSLPEWDQYCQQADPVKPTIDAESRIAGGKSALVPLMHSVNKYFYTTNIDFTAGVIYLDFWARLLHINTLDIGGSNNQTKFFGPCGDWDRPLSSGNVDGPNISYFITSKVDDGWSRRLQYSNGTMYVPHANDTWAHYQLIVRRNTPDQTDGYMEYILDGVSFTGVCSSCTEGDITNHPDAYKAVHFGRYYHDETGTVEVEPQYYDDIYIDNSWARVEIGNAPDYSDCSHREIQLPTAWAAGSISVTVNVGSFAPGESVYLFVTDESGHTSPGYGPVVIGGGSAVDAGPPVDARAELDVRSAEESGVADGGQADAVLAPDVAVSSDLSPALDVRADSGAATDRRVEADSPAAIDRSIVSDLAVEDSAEAVDRRATTDTVVVADAAADSVQVRDTAAGVDRGALTGDGCSCAATSGDGSEAFLLLLPGCCLLRRRWR